MGSDKSTVTEILLSNVGYEKKVNLHVFKEHNGKWNAWFDGSLQKADIAKANSLQDTFHVLVGFVALFEKGIFDKQKHWLPKGSIYKEL
jgi:hypothetical protein